jgi:hypothetical protein
VISPQPGDFTRANHYANTKHSLTIMVYLAGDNNLDAAGVDDLLEMKAVGSTADVNIVAT